MEGEEMRIIMPWDVWLTQAQVLEIADGSHSTDQPIAASIAEAWPAGATDAKFDGKVCTYRGGPADGHSVVVPVPEKQTS